MQTYATWAKLILTRKLQPTDTSLYADRDLWVDKGRLYLVDNNNAEWIEFNWSPTLSWTEYVYPNLVRGLSQTADPSTAWTGLTWLAVTEAKLVAMHDQLFDKQENQTLTKSISFSGATNPWIRANNLTTTQRLALTPSNWTIVYDTTLWENYQYIGGTWYAIAAGSTQPNASDTVAWKVEMTTQAEFDAWTTTGTTWAKIVPTVVEIIAGAKYIWITWEVKIWTTTSAPDSWLICDWSAMSRTTYAPLFTAIGTTYWAGDWSTTFNIPNLKGKIPVGYDAAQTEFDTLWESGWEKTHILTTAEMPSHTHTFTTGYTGGATAIATWGQYSAGWSATTDSTGSWNAHNNLQPYVTLNYIIKI